MKKTYSNIWGSAVAVFAMAFLLGACTQEMDFEEGRKGTPSKYISFTASVKPITASVETRSAGRLTVESEEWPIEGVVTRGAPALSFPENAGIVAYTTTGSDPATLLTSINDKEFSFNNEALSAASNPVPWRNINGTTDQMDVYAYAPYSFIHVVSPTATITTLGTSPVISYTVPADVTAQKDLIVANATVVKASDEYDKTIDLNFTHALAAIRFRVGFECYVKSISIQNVDGSGTYNFSSWTPAGTQNASYTINVSDGSTHFDENEMVTDGDNTLMLIPQTTSNASAQVVLTYKETAEGDEKTLTASITGNEWIAGKRITYIINKDETINYIYFDLAAGDVTIKASGSEYVYSGKVYHNNSTTAITVSGVHSATNKYYIYQSSSVSGSPGYTTSTGFATNKSDVVDWNNPDNWAGIRIPEYDEIKTSDNGTTWSTSTGTKTWSEFVTNNKDSEKIIGYNAEGYFYEHPIKVAKRSNTNNRIMIVAASTAGALDVDMTIDNLWSTFFTMSAMSGYSSAQSSCSLLVDGHNNGSGAHIGLNLKLKGDNLLNRSLFDCRREGDYYIINSFEGDGSTKGSLTIAPNTKKPVSGSSSSSYSMLCGAGVNGGVPHYGFSIKGGTIYVATPTTLCNNADYWTMNCIGAGTNSTINMSISGGIVTAVANSQSAAIGGGAGFGYRGGDGHIDITGGQVYAYHLGCATNGTSGAYSHYITPTAIGGGSSFNSEANGGYVTIGGDAYVYAESVGGVAIGGGSSGGVRGGVGNVTIKDNATVIAKSVDGVIKDYSDNEYPVTAGTSIGGGNGGDEDYKRVSEYGASAGDVANGGSATVTIQNNAIVYAGSIGGGKNGFKTDAEGGGARLLGSATVNLSGNVLVQGQFIMEAPDADTAPTFTMTGGTLQPNKAGDVFHYVKPNGGAVWIDGGTFALSGTGTIKDFSVAYDAGSGDGGLGGAVFMQSTTRASAFNMSGGTIGGCTATSASGTNGLGGAVYMDGGTFSMSGGTIGGSSSMSNQATNGGGAVYLDGGSFNMTGGTISFNRSTANSGGGVFIKGGSFTMNNSSASINYNYAFLNGGGVNVVSDAEAVAVNVVTGTISNNTAERYGGGVCVIPSGVVAANVIYGTYGSDNTALPAITYNGAGVAGGGLYAEGSEAHITLYSGKIKNNSVSANVPNQDIANQYGSVTLQNTDVTAVTITFNVNGGVLSSGSLTQKVAKGTNSLLVLPSVTRQNYNLTDWNTAADGSGTSYTSYEVSPGSGTYNTHDLTGDTTFYAIWTALP